MKVERVIAVSPGDSALLLETGGLIRLTLDAQIHDVIATNGAVVDLNVPCPESDGTPVLDFETLLHRLASRLLDFHCVAVT